MKKYRSTLHWIETLTPKLRIGDLSRITYQKLLNDYAQSHERQTTLDFHHQLKGAILDAVDEGLLIIRYRSYAQSDYQRQSTEK